jgi:hypothetical protein
LAWVRELSVEGDDVTALVGDVIARKLLLDRPVIFQPLTHYPRTTFRSGQLINARGPRKGIEANTLSSRSLTPESH